MTTSAPKPPRSSSIASIAVGAGILLSRVAGLIRVRIFAHYLGNSEAAGAFNAALRIPNLLQNLFGEGALSASFIPVYSRLLAEEKYDEAGRVAANVFSMLLLSVAFLTLIGMAFSQQLTASLAPGFSAETQAMTADLVKIMFPGMGLLVLSAWCLGVLNSHRQFFLSYIAPVFWNIAIIAALVVFGHRLISADQGQAHLVRIVAWATVVGAGLQFLIQLPLSVRANRGLRPTLTTRSAATRQILKNFLPSVVTRGVVQLSAYIDQILASYLGAQAVAAISYAQVLYLLPISLFGMSVSVAELPEMSKTLGTDMQVAAALRLRLIKSIDRLTFFIIPSALAFVVFGDAVVGILLQTGAFNQEHSRYVWLILGGSSLGLLANTQSRVCVSVFWALRDTRTTARYAILRVLLTSILGYLIIFPWRTSLNLPEEYAAAGLTASTGLVGWIELHLIRRKLSQRIGSIPLLNRAILRCWLAGLAAAAMGLFVKFFTMSISRVSAYFLVLTTFGAAYFVLSIFLNVPTAKDTARHIFQRLQRWL